MVIDYYETNPKKVLKEDAQNLDIGLIVVCNSFFTDHRKTLFNTKLPVFKLGKKGFGSLSEAIVLSNDAEEIEKQSSVIFDVA